MSGWESNQVEHTFTTGRTMTVRRSVPLQVLVLKAVDDGDPELAAGLSEWFDKGNLNAADQDQAVQLQMAAKVERAVVEMMFIRPKVHWDPDPDEVERWPVAPEGEPPYHVPVEDLHDAELGEVLELAFKGVAEAARFRGDAGGADGGSNGKGVAKKPKQRARAGAGKR